MNDLVVREVQLPAQLTVAEVTQHIRLVRQAMESVMKEGVHYGVIPGCKQPSLYKPGSEVLLTMFRIAVKPRIEDLSTPDVIRYRVLVDGVHQPTGVLLGTGIGECSSSEDKYRWRQAVCSEEFDATDTTRRRIKFGRKKDGGHYTAKQVRTEPPDLANTILKMAKKRAQIDFTLTATAASDVFAQDLEDLDETLRNLGEEPEGGEQQQGEGQKQSRTDGLKSRMGVKKVATPEDAEAAFGTVQSFEEMNAVVTAVAGMTLTDETKAKLKAAERAAAQRLRNGKSKPPAQPPAEPPPPSADDGQTGSTEQQSAAAAPSSEDVAAMVAKAKTTDDLDVAEDLAASISPGPVREAALGAVKSARQRFAKGARA